MKHRVAITGIGLVTPLGCEPGLFADRLLEGRSGAGPVTLFDPATLPTRIAAEVSDEEIEVRCRDRKVGFAVQAARRALADSGHDGAGAGGLSLGLGLELFSMPDMVDYLAAEGEGSVGDLLAGLEDGPEDREVPRSLSFLQTPSDLCVHWICREHRLHTPPMIHISACAAATDAIGAAFEAIRDGRREWMLAGGADSMINPMGLGGFCKIEATSRRNDEPEKASRPFDRGRDGFLLGEGAGLLVLERLEEARARGARIYGEIAGFGCSFDAHGISEPHPEAEGAVLAIQRALASAGLEPERIDHVNAHGTSTPKNDPTETKALHRVFGEHVARIPVSSTKSMIGHLISAAGSVELAAAVLCARRGRVHPTINLEKPDPACDLDYVPGVAREHEVEYLLKNSFGFGGQNASLVVRVEPDGEGA